MVFGRRGRHHQNQHQQIHLHGPSHGETIGLEDQLKEVIEPSGTNDASITQPKMKNENSSKKRKKAKQTKKMLLKKVKLTTNTLPKEVRKIMIGKKTFFNSMQNIGKNRAALLQKNNALKCYNLALKNLIFEKQFCDFRYVQTSMHVHCSPFAIKSVTFLWKQCAVQNRTENRKLQS